MSMSGISVFNRSNGLARNSTYSETSPLPTEFNIITGGAKKAEKKSSEKKVYAKKSKAVAKKASRKSSRKMKGGSANYIQILTEFKKFIKSSDKSIIDGPVLTMTASKILKEVDRDVKKAKDLYTKYAKSGKFSELMKKSNSEYKAKQAAKKAAKTK